MSIPSRDGWSYVYTVYLHSSAGDCNMTLMLFFPDACSVSPVWRICVSAPFCSLAHYNMSQMTCSICSPVIILMSDFSETIETSQTSLTLHNNVNWVQKLKSWHLHMRPFSRGDRSNMMLKLSVHPGKKYSIYPTLLSWQSHRWRGFSTAQYHTVWLCDFPLWQCVILLHVPLVVRWSFLNS